MQKLFYLEPTKRSLVDEGLKRGRFTYLSPEWGSLGILDMTTDVYIFGMILLELLMGSKDRKKIKEEQGLVDYWTSSFLPDNYKIEEIIDPRLGSDYSANAATQMGTLINRCTAHNTKKRPLMQQVLDGLNHIAEIKD
nr:protein kinase-like [Arabidopsis thaliana]